ncbi:L-threonylcarbamoyladenylate synthase [Synechocystis sp. LKSZ1]|uniref:L-threonylcarbamoyladenylate synthase n=1 Tax=Synechocystis sp. LKSZ1 TaxID=3144951 RepID=UPI00336BFBC4
MPLVTASTLIEAARKGQVVSFPTDTVPALAVLPHQTQAIYQLKQRSLDKPLILMAADIADLLPYLAGTEAERQQWQTVMAQYWPGALTLVLPASSLVSPDLNPRQDGSLGVRIPQHPQALEILAQTGPLATTSANLSGSPPLIMMTAIAEAFPTVLTLAEDLSVQAGASGQPSTVIQWLAPDWQVLRQGSVVLKDIKES